MKAPWAQRSRATQRVAHLDGLRAGAALFVLVHHAFCMAYPINEGIRPTGLIGITLGWMVYGHFGVTVFIVLAGYSLMLGLADRDGALPGGITGYMRRRATRIIPPYWAALALAVVLALTYINSPTGTHWDQSLPTDPKGWLSDFLLLQDASPYTDAAYTFWSIAVEWHIYLLLPIILWLRRRSSSWTLAVTLASAASALVLAASQFHAAFLHALFPSYYLLFSLATGACVLVKRRPDLAARLSPGALSLGLFAVVVAICVVLPYDTVSANYYWIDVILGLSVICLLICLETGGVRWLSAALSWSPLAGMAGFSYSLYLVHAPLLQVFWQVVEMPAGLTRPASLALIWLVGVPIIVLLSYVFHLFAERPFTPDPRSTRRLVRSQRRSPAHLSN